MAITSGNFGLALWPGINKWFGQAYNEHPVEYTDLFDSFTSRKAWEIDVSVSSFGLAQIKGEGSPITYDNEQQGFQTRYTHVVYGLGFIITREIVEDDLYDIVGERRARRLAFSMRQTKEHVAANVYNRAFNPNYAGGDGKELLATNHPNVAGGTYANELMVAADLSEAALEQACIDIMKFTNDRGHKINVMPKVLIVPVDLAFEADKIMKTEYEVGTANNTINAVRSKFPGGVKVNHYLTDPDAWFIRTTAPDGMKHFQRSPLRFGQEVDFDTDNFKFKATERYSFFWSDPRGLFGSPGA